MGGDGLYHAGKFIAFVVKERNEATLRALIEEHILPGSVIYSDEWKAYTNIDTWMWLPELEDGVIEKRYLGHQTVNHSKELIAMDGTHTNTIEGYWRVAKNRIPKKSFADAKTVQEHLYQQLWESSWTGRVWEGLLVTLREVKYDKEEHILSLEKGDDPDNSVDWIWEAQEETAHDTYLI